MNVGFFTVFRRDPQHLLHAEGLTADVRRVMPTATIVQFTDDRTPDVTGVDRVQRLAHGPMLERRIEHYATATSNGDSWLLVDTDVRVLRNVEEVFAPRADVAIADRNWAGIPQGDDVMHTMPFNTGVVFTRIGGFWDDVLSVWRAYPADRRDWLSEQRAVYEVIRSGAYRVQILPGDVYNYPPRTQDDPCTGVAIAHYKGPRKPWLSAVIEKSWQTSPELVAV